MNAANPEGPVDHDVPVLRVETPDGKLRAVVFGYACHNTTLQFYQWCGDYAGFAQKYLEEKHPGATALFWMGCGGDANPLPRSKVELCKKYGRELADAVEDVHRRPHDADHRRQRGEVCDHRSAAGQAARPRHGGRPTPSKQYAVRKRAERS